MDRKELALTLHGKSFNCAQSVACSYCDVMGADPVTTFRLAEGLGFGIGTMDACGCITGAAMAVGMKMSDANLDAPKTKKQCYAMMGEVKKAFVEKFGTTICSELKDKQREGGAASCNELIAGTIEILDDLLLGIKPEEK